MSGRPSIQQAARAIVVPKYPALALVAGGLIGDHYGLARQAKGCQGAVPPETVLF
jgi:hypothetical protein